MNRIVFFLLVLPCLHACSTLGGAATDAMKAYYDSKVGGSFAELPLNPQYVYLEIQSPTASALMVLATVDEPVNGGLPVETWVSASREVLRTQGGLVVGSEGVPNIWRQADVRRNENGEPVAWVIDSPAHDVFQLQQQVVPLQRGSVNLRPTPLMKRAQQAPSFNLQAWRGVNIPARPSQTNLDTERAQALNNNLQVLGTTNNGAAWVYGQHCPRQNYCIEFLRRTAAQNL